MGVSCFFELEKVNKNNVLGVLFGRARQNIQKIPLLMRAGGFFVSSADGSARAKFSSG